LVGEKGDKRGLGAPDSYELVWKYQVSFLLLLKRVSAVPKLTSS
jgi:hypothetical protein